MEIPVLFTFLSPTEQAIVSRARSASCSCALGGPLSPPLVDLSLPPARQPPQHHRVDRRHGSGVAQRRQRLPERPLPLHPGASLEATWPYDPASWWEHCFGAGTPSTSTPTGSSELREPGENGYKIPHGGGYRFISCPNYLGDDGMGRLGTLLLEPRRAGLFAWTPTWLHGPSRPIVGTKSGFDYPADQGGPSALHRVDQDTSSPDGPPDRRAIEWPGGAVFCHRTRTAGDVVITGMGQTRTRAPVARSVFWVMLSVVAWEFFQFIRSEPGNLCCSWALPLVDLLFLCYCPLLALCPHPTVPGSQPINAGHSQHLFDHFRACLPGCSGSTSASA